jgi:hypothetical protein
VPDNKADAVPGEHLHPILQSQLEKIIASSILLW